MDFLSDPKYLSLTSFCGYFKHIIYWSNVLTERFSISYKNQTKEDKSF